MIRMKEYKRLWSKVEPCIYSSSLGVSSLAFNSLALHVFSLAKKSCDMRYHINLRSNKFGCITDMLGGCSLAELLTGSHHLHKVGYLALE